jgi:acyl carrier protein
LKQEVSNWVVEWFSSRGKVRCEAREALQIDYLQSGLLSSLEIVEFVAELEDRFGVQFSEEEMQDPRFSTIGGIAQLVIAGLNRAESEQADSDHTGQERVDQSTKV